MAEKLELQATVRTAVGRNEVKKLRDSLIIPAILYGREQESRPLQLAATDFAKIYEQAGESTLISLNVANERAVKVVVHDIQRHPLTNVITHVDLQQVRMDEKMRAEVELNFVGEAPAVKELSGILVKNIAHLEVECLPADLPHEITVDISVLKTFDDTIRISDLAIPNGVSLFLDPQNMVASVTPPRSEEELKELETAVVEDVNKVEAVKVKEKEEVVEGAEGTTAAAAPSGEAVKK